MAYFGAIEGGGTKYLCAIATTPRPDAIVASARIDTTTPERTLAEVIAFFRSHDLAGLGIANFGPIDLDEASPTHGYVLATPKAGWRDQPVLAVIADGLGLPRTKTRWELDVNAAAIGEYRWGAAQGISPMIYLTVGTGIGGGILLEGRPLRGLLHAEIGHVPTPPIRLSDGNLDTFESGVCPYHRDCWESRATGPALGARAGRRAEEIADDDPMWDVEAQYLAFGIATCTLVVSPRRIVIGGGVVESRAAWFVPRIRQHLIRILGGYVDRPEVTQRVDDYLVPAALRDPSSGIAGALALAGDAASGLA